MSEEFTKGRGVVLASQTKVGDSLISLEVKIPVDSELETAVTRAMNYLNKVAELDLNFVDTVYYLLCIGASEEVYKIYGSLYKKDDG